MRPGLFSSLKGTAATLVAIFRTRLELLASELEEEKIRLLSLLLFALGALFFLALGLVVLFGFGRLERAMGHLGRALLELGSCLGYRARILARRWRSV